VKITEVRREFAGQEAMTLLQQAADKLGHDMGKRPTDLVLANAALIGHTGRAREAAASLHAPPLTHRRARTLSDAATDHRADMKKRGGIRATLERLSRIWRLYRAQQVDQNGYPACVGATEEHWEKSLPVYMRKGLGFLAMYQEAKKIDGYAGEGTDALSMYLVCKNLGLVDGDPYWYGGPQDDEALDYWLENVGGVWVGWNIPESMFRTDQANPMATAPLSGAFQYGHEMFFLGTDRKAKTRMGVQSWGRENYGVDGRFTVRDDQWATLHSNGGDCLGAKQRAA
jgi:hypothetical protein